MSMRSNKLIFTAIGVCAVIMAAASTNAMPSGDSEAPILSSRELEAIPLRQVYNGVPVLRDAIRKLLISGQVPPAPVVRVEACMTYSLAS